MKINTKLLKVLSKVYQPSARIETTFGRYDLVFKTDEFGRPVLFFIGKMNEHGEIKGERFVRRLVMNNNDAIVKDHWDNKGKV